MSVLYSVLSDMARKVHFCYLC